MDCGRHFRACLRCSRGALGRARRVRLDSFIEIGASAVVLWELSGIGEARQRRALRLIGRAFVALAVYLLVQSTWTLASGSHPHHSPLGIAWTAVTAAVMFALAAGKARTGRALGNPVLLTEGRVTTIDSLLAVAVLVGLVLNAVFGWWWADPLAAFVLVYYALREAWHIFTETDERQVPLHQQNHVWPNFHPSATARREPSS
jgi:Cation efflux family